MLLFQKGQTIDNRYTVVFPHKEGTYAETNRVLQLPQWFFLPPFGESHGGRVNGGIVGEQCLDVLNESVRRINGVQPIGDATKLRIKFKMMYVPVCNPRQSCLSRQLGHNRKTTIPDAGMVSTFVSQDSDTCQPTAQNEMLRQPEVFCHQIFRSMVREVGIKFRNGAKCQNLKCFPYRREFWGVIFCKMFRNEVFLRSLDFTTNMCDIGLKTLRILTEIFISKPERVVTSREIANHLTTSSDFYLEDGIENELLQFGVKAIDSNDVAEMNIGLKGMTFPVNLHRAPIISKAKVAHSVKDGFGFSLIVNNKLPLLQSFNLLCEGKNLFGIFHTKKTKSRPVALPKRGRVPGSVGCKVTNFNRNNQMFWKRSA